MTASLILRKLGSYPRQNSLALALREIGRIERTLFTLAWKQETHLREPSSLTAWAKSEIDPLKTNATAPVG
jgi:TnpA family transposase